MGSNVKRVCDFVGRAPEGQRIVATGGAQRNPWYAKTLKSLSAPEGRRIPASIVPSVVVLKGMGIRHLVVTGCTTSICVESTIRDAMYRDYSCVLLADCTAEPIGHGLPRSNHDATLLVIRTLLGWTSSSDEFIKALESHTSHP